MDPPQETDLSRADWVRIQSVLNQPEAKVYTRLEVIESNILYQSSIVKKSLNAQGKLLEARKLKKQAREEYLNMLAAEEAEFKKQDLKQTIDKANSKRFHQIARVRQFNRAVQMTHVQKENEALIEFHQEQQRLAKQRKRKSEEEMRCRHEEALRQEQEKAQQRQLSNQSVAHYQTEQIKELKQLREREREQEKEERDKLRYFDELHAQGQRNQAEQKAESKKSYLKSRLEDISSRNLHKEREAQEQNMLEKERKRVQCDIEEKLQQRKDYQAEKFRKRQIPIEIATVKLADRLKKQAAAGVLREDPTFSKEVAEQVTKVADQQREKEKRDAMLKSISSHREAKIQENEQKLKAEKKSNLEWFQAKKVSDRLFLEERKRKAQKTRENNIKCRYSNVALMANKRACAEQLKRQEHDTAVKNAEQAAERQCELHKAAEDSRNGSHLLAASTTGHGLFVNGEEPDCSAKNTGEPLPRCTTDQTRFMKRYQERKSLQLSKVNMDPTCLPSISGAAKPNFTAKGSVGGHVEWSNYCAKGTENSLPGLGIYRAWPTRQHQVCNKMKLVRAWTNKLPTHLPSIPNQVRNKLQNVNEGADKLHLQLPCLPTISKG